MVLPSLLNNRASSPVVCALFSAQREMNSSFYPLKTSPFAEAPADEVDVTAQGA